MKTDSGGSTCLNKSIDLGDRLGVCILISFQLEVYAGKYRGARLMGSKR